MKFFEEMREIFFVDAEFLQFDRAEAGRIDEISVGEFKQFRDARCIFSALDSIADLSDCLID